MVKKYFDVGPYCLKSERLKTSAHVVMPCPSGAAACHVPFLKFLNFSGILMSVPPFLVYILSSSVLSLGVSVHCSSSRERSLKTLSEREKKPKLSTRFL